jgi:leader peptidase (prepilin peptidase) / N-methyltransferase
MPILDIVALIPLAYLAVVATPLIITDVREHRLPNKFVLPFIAISFLTSIAVAIITGDWIRLLITVGVAIAILALGIYLNAKDRIGMGDVKLYVGVALSLTTFSIWFVLATILVSLAVAFVVTIVAVIRQSSIASVQLGTYIIPTTLLFGVVAVLS